MSAIQPLDSIIIGSIILVLALSPLARGAVDVTSICIIVIFTITSFLLFLIRLTLKENQEIKLSGLELPLLSLFLLGTISSFFSIYPAQSRRELGFFFCCLLFFFIVQNLFSDRKRIYLLSLTIIITGITLSILGLFCYAIFMGTPSWEPSLSSTYVNRNHFAGYLELCLPLSLGMVEYITDKGKKVLLIYGIILMVISLLLSLSRGGWIGGSLSLFFMAFLAKKRGLLSRRIWIVSVVGFILFLTSVLGLNSIAERISTFENIFKDPVNFDTRVKVWKGTLEIIQKNPFSGTGIGTFAYAFPSHRPLGVTQRYLYAHNDFLHFTSEMGIFFLPLFLWLLFSGLRIGTNTFFKTKSRLKRGVSLGCSMGILALSIHSIFDFNLHIPANLLLFFTFLGMIGAIRK